MCPDARPDARPAVVLSYARMLIRAQRRFDASNRALERIRHEASARNAPHRLQPLSAQAMPAQAMVEQAMGAPAMVAPAMAA